MGFILDTFSKIFNWSEKVVKEDLAEELTEKEKETYLTKIEGFKRELQEMKEK